MKEEASQIFGVTARTLFKWIKRKEQNCLALIKQGIHLINRLDTIEVLRGKPIDIQSIHGMCSIFRDKEILKCHAVIRRELLKNRINAIGKRRTYIGFIQNNQAVIQQQATRDVLQ